MNNKIITASYLSKIYNIKPIRYIIKFTISMTIVKMFNDLFQYWAFGKQITIPRYCHVIGVQHALNPPMLIPFPFQNNAQQIYDTREYDNLHFKMAENLLQRNSRLKFMYAYHPWTQHSNEVDNFLKYSEHSRILQPIYYRVLKKMQQKGIEIPHGISQSIRSLEQYKLDFHPLIIPQL